MVCILQDNEAHKSGFNSAKRRSRWYLQTRVENKYTTWWSAWGFMYNKLNIREEYPDALELLPFRVFRWPSDSACDDQKCSGKESAMTFSSAQYLCLTSYLHIVLKLKCENQNRCFSKCIKSWVKQMKAWKLNGCVHHASRILLSIVRSGIRLRHMDMVDLCRRSRCIYWDEERFTCDTTISW